MAQIKTIFFFIFISINCSFGQIIELGSPFCENISPKEIGYGGPNYSISQGILGNMYFGNSNGILSYNTLHWNLIPFSGKPLIYKDKIGNMFVGGFNQIAEINMDSYDNLELKNLVPEKSDFGQVSALISFRNELFFVANNILYKIEKNNYTQILKDNLHLKIFIDRDNLFISTSNNLYIYSTNGLLKFEERPLFKNKKIYDVIRISNRLIFRTETGFIEYSKEFGVKLFRTQIDEELNTFGYSCSEKLSNNTICIGTISNGLYFIDENGVLINYLNSENGLYDNTIYDMFVDKANQLWVGLSNGIARIEVPSAFTYFNNSNGLSGKVQAIIRYKNNMYIGTHKGIYKINKYAQTNSFVKIEPFNTECKSFVIFNNELYAATAKGLYKISESNSELIFEGNIVSLKKDSFKNEIWFATQKKIYKIAFPKFPNTRVKNITSFGNTMADFQTLVVEQDGTVWAGTSVDGLYVIKKDSLQKVVSKGLPQKSTWIQVYETSLGTIFSTDEGLFRFDSDIQFFYKDTKISIPIELSNDRISPIIEDLDKNLWITFSTKGLYENQISVAWASEDGSGYTLVSNQFGKLKNFICNTMYPDINSVVWFGGFDGLIRLDFKQLNAKRNPEQTLIQSINIGKDSVFINYYKTVNDEFVLLPYTLNSVRFDFAAPIFEDRKNTRYTYLLEGYAQEWSKPEYITHKEFSNLPAGKYTFYVKAIDSNGNISEAAVFKFEIEQNVFFKWWAISLYVLLLASVIAFVFRWRAFKFLKEKARLSEIIREKTEELLLEKEKTENLLSNILPEETVKELKEKGKASSMRFNMATILFSDIQGFTKIAEEMNPDTLIDELDKFFLEFDRIVERHNIEKIKTIGDAYMCAGGIPQKNRTNPIEVVVAALEMQNVMLQLQKANHLIGKDYWGLRIGIHTGPIIAGVVGSKKFTYDIWGDSVNIASRMESSGEVGKVNISENTYFLIQEFFDCEYRGKMPVKYKGEIDMYFVKGFKVFFSDDPIRILPNSKFNYKFSLIKFEDLQEMMFERMEKELPANLYYHNLKHTIDVTVQIEIIGIEEKVSDEEMLLLKTAALFHDSGFLLGYSDHEELSIQLARTILPKYHFNENQIDIVAGLIQVTKLPTNPKTHLQNIMCDADLDYLGRNDYLPVSRDLYRELIEQGILHKSEYEWNKMQIKFLQNHVFYTESSKDRRTASKNKQIEKLQEQTRSFNKINK